MNRYTDNSLDLDNPAPRCPVILLLDTSSSMDGAPINELNAGLRQFIAETSADEAASRSVELEVITFDDKASVEIPFTAIANVPKNPQALEADGMTFMGAGMKMAMNELHKRRKLYASNGISAYRPWVILMTDGAPNDEGWEEQAAALRSLGMSGKIQYLGIAIGESANEVLLRNILTPALMPVHLKGLQFKAFFRWLTDSMRSVSTSTVSEQDNVQFRGIEDWGELL